MSCQSLRQQLTEFKNQFEQMQGYIGQYLSDPDGFEQQHPDYSAQIADLKFRKAKFLEEYQKSAVELLKRWYDWRYADASKWVDVLLEEDRIEFEENGRVAIRYGLILGESHTYLPSIIRKVGGLATGRSDLNSADYLEEVVQDVRVGSSMQSMERLRYIGGDGRFYRSDIRHLDSLEEVNGHLLFYGTDAIGRGAGIHLVSSPIETIARLRKVGKFLNLSKTPLKSLPRLEEVGEALHIQEGEFEEAENLVKIGGSVWISGVKFPSFRKAFPALKEIDADNTGLSVHFEPNSVPQEILDEIHRLKDSGEIKMGEIEANEP